MTALSFVQIKYYKIIGCLEQTGKKNAVILLKSIFFYIFLKLLDNFTVSLPGKTMLKFNYKFKNPASCSNF